MSPSLTDRAFVLLQHLLPQHMLSALMYRIARCKQPWFAQGLIQIFSRIYRVDLNEAAETDRHRYPHFNAFFTRALKPGARPLAGSPDAVLCPADGRISQIGPIDGTSILQAKGQSFDLTALLGGDPRRAAPFVGGRFATIYLSPKDYHRLHMPLAARLTEMVHVPGRLFSVNDATASLVPGLFARNERVVACFEAPAGPMALVLVGAIFVGSIETVWHGQVTPCPAPRTLRTWDYRGADQHFERGMEMGRFNMGSTIIVLFGPGRITWDPALQCGSPVRVGQQLGTCSA
jgi:phosphatidylserine decarboxylase